MKAFQLKLVTVLNLSFLQVLWHNCEKLFFTILSYEVVLILLRRPSGVIACADTVNWNNRQYPKVRTFFNGKRHRHVKTS